MNDPATAAKSVCQSPRCATVFDGLEAKCPMCGYRAVPQKRIRMLGWLLIGCGLLLLGIMIPVCVAIVPSMMQPGAEVGGTSFTGSESDASSALVIFAMVIAFGLAALASGTYQVRYGRQNWFLVIGMLVLGAVMFVGAKLFIFAQAV
jgi:hypothetical protein